MQVEAGVIKAGAAKIGEIGKENVKKPQYYQILLWIYTIVSAQRRDFLLLYRMPFTFSSMFGYKHGSIGDLIFVPEFASKRTQVWSVTAKEKTRAVVEMKTLFDTKPYPKAARISARFLVIG